MSGSFKVGDVVVCVREHSSDEWFHGPRQIFQGKVYRVSRAGNWRGIAVVALCGIEANTCANAFAAERFRHLPRADDQFTTQMRALKPHKVDA